MRRSSIVFLILVSLAAVAYGQANNAAVEKEIRQLRQEFFEAARGSDGATQIVSRLLADDFLWLGMQDFPPFGKAIVLASNNRSDGRPTTRNDAELKFRVYSETVIVTGQSEVTFTRPGDTDDVRRHYFTEVWLKRQGAMATCLNAYLPNRATANHGKEGAMLAPCR